MKPRSALSSGGPHVRLGIPSPPKKPSVKQPSKQQQPSIAHWLDRNQAASLLGITIQSIYVLERKGKLHSAKDWRRDSRGIERWVFVYDPLELAKVPTQSRNQMRSPGEIAARVFEMLDEGCTTRDIVIAVRELPNVIEEYRAQWNDSGGSERVLTTVAWQRLEQLVGKFSSVTELVERIEKRIAPNGGAPGNSPETA